MAQVPMWVLPLLHIRAFLLSVLRVAPKQEQKFQEWLHQCSKNFRSNWEEKIPISFLKIAILNMHFPPPSNHPSAIRAKFAFAALAFLLNVPSTTSSKKHWWQKPNNLKRATLRIKKIFWEPLCPNHITKKFFPT